MNMAVGQSPEFFFVFLSSALRTAMPGFSANATRLEPKKVSQYVASQIRVLSSGSLSSPRSRPTGFICGGKLAASRVRVRSLLIMSFRVTRRENPPALCLQDKECRRNSSTTVLQ